MSMNVIETSGLSKRYGSTWALRECTLAIPAGHVAALVGPNGAGKTTLLNLAVGMLAPTTGTIEVLGGRSAGSPAALDGIAFVAQDTPLYKNLSAADMLHLTRNLNHRFDQAYAQARLAELGIPLTLKAGKLSGGQQAQLALTLALARRPRLLLLDEPVAMLDPVARHDFMATVLTAMADEGGGDAMTALTAPARAEQNASLRPVPWRRMAWVTWRQHRFALGGVAALLGGLAVYLWLAGLHLHHAYAVAAACRPTTSDACATMLSNINRPTTEIVPVLLQAVPALIGGFVGAPVLARELETGTFRYAWTQGFGRWRWALAKLVPLAVVVTAAAGAFSVLFSWYFEPFFADGWQIPFGPIVFDLRGDAFAAWTLAAFAIGALAGMLIRRVVPAIAATLAVYAGLALAAGLYLRQHYLTPLLTTNPSVSGSAWTNPNVSGSPWMIGQWWTKGGKPVSESVIGQVLQQGAPQLSPKGGVPQSPDVTQYLMQHGYTLWASYQPGSRFWPFQWIEGGWLLALSVLLITATIWLVRRRAA